VTARGGEQDGITSRKHNKTTSRQVEPPPVMLDYSTRQLLAVLAATALLLPCAASPAGQKPLTSWADSSPPLYSFTKVEQSADLCDAGSKFWTGSVQISPEKSMFYCEWPC
jgi:hypothetical protein